MQSHPIEPVLQSEDRTKSNWKRRILIGVACLLGVLVVGWWIISSEMFLRDVVIKKIGQAIHAEITFESADWSLRRSVVLRGVRMKAIGQESCLEAKEITVNYQLGDLLAGKIDLGNITIVEPIISIHMDAEGKTNLDPFFDIQREPGKQTQVRIGQLVLQQGTVNFHRQSYDGNEEHVTATHVEFRGEEVGNQRTSTLTLAAGVQYALHRAQVKTDDVLRGTISMKTEQELGLNWLPKSVIAEAKMKAIESSGQFAFANGLEASLKSHSTHAEMRNFQLNFQHEGNPIGNLMLGGPMDIRNGSADLQVAIKGIEGHVLNFVGRPYGFEFHDTVLSSTNRLVLGGFGKQIKLRGAINATPVQMSLDRVSLPSVDVLETQYDFTVDLGGKRAIFDVLNLKATHKTKQFLAGEINQTMTIAWGGDVMEAPDSEFELEVTNTDMADWQPWLGRYVKSGAMAANAKIGVRKNGREVRFGSSGSITSLQLPLDGKVIEIGDFNLTAQGQVIDFQKLNFTQFVAEAGLPGKNYFKYEGKPIVDITGHSVSGIGKLEGELPVFLSWFPQKEVNCRAGRVEYAGSFSANLRHPQSQSVDGTLRMKNVQATIRENSLTNFTATAEVKMRLDEGHRLHIGSLNANGYLNKGRLASQVYATGVWNLLNGSAKLDMAVVKGLDLALLKTIVPLKGILTGRVDANLKSVNHIPGKTTTAEVSASIRGGAMKGWAADLNIDCSSDVKLTGLDRGKFRIQANNLLLQSLNRKNHEQQDAEMKGAAMYDFSKGAFDVTLTTSEWTQPFVQPLLATYLGEIELLDVKISHTEPISLQGDGQGVLAVKGPVKVERMRLKDPDGKLPEGRLAADAILDLKFTRKGNNWSIEANKTTASFLLDDRNAGMISLGGNYQSHRSAGNFDVTIRNVDHHVVSLLSKRWNDEAQMVAGRVVSLESKGVFGDQKAAGSLNVKLVGADIRVKNGAWPPGPMDVEYELKNAVITFGGDKWDFEAETNKLDVKQDGVDVASYDIKQSVKDSDYSFNIKTLNLKPPFTSLGLKKWLPNQEVKPGLLTVNESELQLDSKGNGHFKGNIEFSGFAFPSSESGGEPVRLDSSFIIDAGATNHVFSIKRFTANLPPTAKAKNEGTISGHVDLSNPSAPSGRIQLKSDALDITPLVALLKPAKVQTKGKTAPKPASTPTPPATGLSPVPRDDQQLSSDRFSFHQFSADLDVKQIHWRDLNATDVKGEIVFDGKEYTFRPLQLKLLDAPLMLEGSYLPQSDGRTRYALNISCEKLPISPLVRHFNADDRRQWGLLSANLHARTLATQGSDFQRSFKIRGIDQESPAWMFVTGAHWGFREDDFLVRFIASALRVPELLDSKFDTARLNLTADKGKALYDLEAGGPLIRTRVEGTSDLAEDWLDSIVQEDVEIALAPKLAREFKPAGINFKGDNFMQLPTFLSLNGPVRRPDVDVNEFAVGHILLLGISGLPGNILRNIPIPFLNEPKNPDGTKKINPLNPFDLLRLVIPGGDER